MGYNVMCMLQHDPTKQGMGWTFLKDECLLDIEVLGSFKTFKFILMLITSFVPWIFGIKEIRWSYEKRTIE